MSLWHRGMCSVPFTSPKKSEGGLSKVVQMLYMASGSRSVRGVRSKWFAGGCFMSTFDETAAFFGPPTAYVTFLSQWSVQASFPMGFPLLSGSVVLSPGM